jgi:hypothetical protein
VTLNKRASLSETQSMLAAPEPTGAHRSDPAYPIRLSSDGALGQKGTRRFNAQIGALQARLSDSQS